MGASDITQNDLTADELRIYQSVRSKGYNVSPRAIRDNRFEENWISDEGVFSPTYAVLVGADTYEEGDNISFDISATNISPAADLYFTLSGADGAIDGTDFEIASLSGTVSLVENVGLQTTTLELTSLATAVSTDVDFTLQLRTSGYTGTIVATDTFTLTSV